MFKNSGKKIMGFVKFVFGLNVVIALLALAAGVVYAVSEFSYSTSTMVLVIVGCVLAVLLYLLLVFFSLLSLYAFGELTQSNLEIQRTLTEMQASASRVVPQPYRESVRVARREEPRPAPAAPAAAVKPAEPEIAPIPEAPAPAPQPERGATFAFDYKAAAGAPAFPVNSSAPAATEQPLPEVLICSKCGAKHGPAANNCRYCGNPLRG
jgi:ribosomal protein L40E